MDKTPNINPLGICPHDTVKREFDSEENYLDKWTCQMCHAEFFTLDGMKAGKITVMEPHLTLRDQFAMAALTGIISGFASETDKWQSGDVAKLSYAAADDMLKAREK